MCSLQLGLSERWQVQYRQGNTRAAEAGAEIMLGCMATEIKETVGGVTVKGQLLDIRTHVGVFSITANHLIMSTGAIVTPSLLLESGFGDVNPHIGTGLHLQPVANIFGLMPEPIESRVRHSGTLCRRVC